MAQGFALIRRRSMRKFRWRERGLQTPVCLYLSLGWPFRLAAPALSRPPDISEALVEGLTVGYVVRPPRSQEASSCSISVEIFFSLFVSASVKSVLLPRFSVPINGGRLFCSQGRFWVNLVWSSAIGQCATKRGSPYKRPTALPGP